MRVKTRFKRTTRIYVTNYAINSDEHTVKQLGEPYTWPEWEQFDSYFCSDCLEFFQEWDFSKYNFGNPEYIKDEDVETYREAHRDEEGRKKKLAISIKEVYSFFYYGII